MRQVEKYSDKNIYRDSVLIGKIHHSLEDPVSNSLYYLSDKIAPVLKYINQTPNQVTTMRFSLLLIALLYCIPQKMYRLGAILYSRKYDMVTQFGDYYDHVADITGQILTMYILYNTVDDPHQWIVHLLVIMLILSMVQIGCQERYIDMMKLSSGYTSPSIESSTYLCPKSIVPDNDVEYLMEYTRLCGVGTVQLIIAIILWNLESIS